MDFQEFVESVEQKNAPKKECKGKIYRAHLNAFINSDGVYVEQKRMYPMKRLSCKGCEQCGWMVDDLKEQLFNTQSTLADDLEDKALYRLAVDNVSRDWESGIVDDWDIIFEKVKE